MINEIKEKYFTPKQVEVLERVLSDDWFMLILHGAVRAGKTQLNNDLFLLELLRVKEQAKKDGVANPMYILAAYSSNTLQTNILTELSNKYGIEFKFDRHNNFSLFGVKVITTFTSSVSGIGAVRGMSSYGAYINEGSLAKEEVFKEIINRCSEDGARIMVDTNPDHPEHYLKRDYIDKADGKVILEYNFTLFDNPFLSERYVNNLVAVTPSGPFTERSIFGRWTIGEGAIYKDFNDKKHYVDLEDLPDNLRYIVGVDWGYEHYGSMVVVGIDDNDAYYLIEENAYQHLHIDDWVEVAKKLTHKYGLNIPFFCDSARPEYVDRLYYEGLNAMNANKAVLPGITEVATLIKDYKFYALNSLERFKKEINQYVWNKLGDMPAKEMDDVLDAVRYAVYSDKMAQEQGFY